MKKNGFLLLCLAVAVLMIAGGIQKRTALRDVREKPLYLYRITYTVEVSELADYEAEAIKVGAALYLEDNTYMGTVEAVETRPAATEDTRDLTLTVSGIGGKYSNAQALEYDLTKGNRLRFLTRYTGFEGVVTHIREVDM